MFVLPGNKLNLEAFSFTERVVGYQWRVVESVSHLLDYRHKKVKDKRETSKGLHSADEIASGIKLHQWRLFYW